MRKLNVNDKLRELNVVPEAVCLGEFDLIGELTARKMRDLSEPNFAKFGAFFRPNYERGILLYYLIRQCNIKSVLEIGFGRGYGALCAAKAFHDAGIDGRVTSVDPQPWSTTNEPKIKSLLGSFEPLSSYVDLVVGTSQDAIPQLRKSNPQGWDLVYIDGDHSYFGTKSDWLSIQDAWNKLVLFDDYHLPSKNDPGIQCSRAIDEIGDEQFTRELILTDRRMFHDERGIADDELDYGQVLVSKKESV